ncbi:hypothetical protein L6164_035696 [Bauhinia variegata]|uniref:Uncharacterized protein n=1 Tax=Bauhinia variegata TaxID=167791 RepID=A0ACB9KEU1_BAUVA|nr:hypothetical protein L6164_035696 [Bauhinia variegata]
MAPGHILPVVNMVKLFASRGVKATIVTTPLNAPSIAKSIDRIPSTFPKIDLKILTFPSKEAGLAEGIENVHSVTDRETYIKLLKATSLFQRPLGEAMQELRPHALVADVFFPWATDVASKYGIPRLIFHGTSFFSMCVAESLAKHKPHKNVQSDTEQFIVPGLPDQINLTRLQLSDDTRLGMENDVTKLLTRAKEMEERSFGILVNSFYELEPAYADHYRDVVGNKAWTVGPVTFCGDRAPREDNQECLTWLNRKNPNSVVFCCFGTSTRLSDSQLYEIAMGLEASGQQFIWVVRREKKNGVEEKWLPEGYEERIEEKGLILRGWAPQVLILNHEAVGGFVTHCGWNSVLEGISAGVPMVAWPVFAEQFYNEKLITDLLGIGVGVGCQKWVALVGDFVRREKIEKAVKELMVGEKAEEMRKRAKALGEKASSAVEQGGSSYSDTSALIEELKNYRTLENASSHQM